jgi:hypothetical protein
MALVSGPQVRTVPAPDASDRPTGAIAAPFGPMLLSEPASGPASAVMPSDASSFVGEEPPPVPDESVASLPAPGVDPASPGANPAEASLPSIRPGSVGRSAPPVGEGWPTVAPVGVPLDDGVPVRPGSAGELDVGDAVWVGRGVGAGLVLGEGVGVGRGVEVAVGLGLGVGVGVEVGLGVGVGDGLAVGDGCGVTVGAAVGGLVGTGVGVGVQLLPIWLPWPLSQGSEPAVPVVAATGRTRPSRRSPAATMAAAHDHRSCRAR